MNSEHFLVTKKGNEQFRRQVKSEQRKAELLGEGISTSSVIAGHLMVEARQSLLDLNARERAGEVIENIDDIRTTQYAAIFMGVLIRQSEKIKTNTFSLTNVIECTNKAISGTGLEELPTVSLESKLRSETWKKHNEISREDETGATFLRDRDNFPTQLYGYVMGNTGVPQRLYAWIQTRGMIDDYEDMARSVIYPDVLLGPDAFKANNRRFTKGMKKRVREFLKTYDPSNEVPRGGDNTFVDSGEQKKEKPEEIAAEFETDYQERRDAADLADEFFKAGCPPRSPVAPPEPLPDDTDALVGAIIGNTSVLSDLQQRRLDQEALRNVVSADTFDRPIGVVNLESGDQEDHRKKKLKTTPSYFGVVHEDHLEQDLAVVDADKKKLIADVAVNLIQTGKKHNWGESARKLAKKGRKELSRKRALQRERAGGIDLEDPAEAAVTAHRLTEAVGASRVLTEGEAVVVEKRNLEHIKHRHIEEDPIPEFEEKIHLGYVDGKELWYLEPTGDTRGADLRATVKKKVIDAHDNLIRQSTTELPAQGDEEAMEGLFHELFRKGRIDPLIQEKPEQTATRYVKRVHELMNPDKIWKVPKDYKSENPAGDLIDKAFLRDEAAERLGKILEAMGKGEEAASIKADAKASSLDSDDRYTTVLIKMAAEYNRLITLGGIVLGSEHMDDSLKAIEKQADQLWKESQGDSHAA